MTESQITFETQDGRELLLEGVHYDVVIAGLMAKTSIVQSYSNPYDTNIEAVYTFPLSADAVLLGIEIRINDRVLKGTIKEKSQAEAEYEEAIDDGNRAIMVEKSSDGIYTVNIANILPNDNIAVSIEYTQLLEWKQDQVKWSLPTTIAPKYGNASNLNLDDVTVPSVSLLAENLFSFKMVVQGVLADSQINAPSHRIDVNKYEDSTLITLENEKDFMDKDIVFTFKTKKAREERAFTLVGKDFDGYSSIASFYPSFGKDLPKQPKSVTFVIDCSGSMHGVSIDRARTALSKALNLFTEEDSFNIIKFGSNHTSLFDNEVPATTANLNIAKRMVRSLNADMGGTEMESALQSAYNGHTVSKDKQGYLFLITDGEIYDHHTVVKSAKRSEMSHYVVGVGYASDDPLLKRIAKVTRGSYENIDPNEKMDDYILNLFKKIDTPKAINIKVQWPNKTIIEHTPSVVFDGDTLYAYATSVEPMSGEVTLAYTLENGNQHASSVTIEANILADPVNPSVVSKQVIAKEIEDLNTKRPQGRYYREDTSSEESKEIVELSIRYQLFSELTNYILVDEVAEDEKPMNLPEVHKVDNMLVPSLAIGYNSSHMSGIVEDSVCDDLRISPINCCFEERASDDTSGELYFDDIPEISSSISDIDIDYIFDGIEASEYKRYLTLLNDWYVTYHRLPRKKPELSSAGFDFKTAGLFNKDQFRKQIKAFVMELYMVCEDHDDLSSEFIKYIEKKLISKQSLREKFDNSVMWVKQLF